MTWGASAVNDKAIAWAVTRAVGDIVVPVPEQVLLGVVYGPTGADYTGTAQGGSGPSAADIAAAVWQQPIESSLSADQLMRVMAAALAGVTQKSGNTITFKGVDGVTDRIVGSFDAENNRTGAILDGD